MIPGVDQVEEPEAVRHEGDDEHKAAKKASDLAKEHDHEADVKEL